ncbi:hypothetical protein [Nocardiopsis aegyptia]|uniref:DUF998 domain-containing protein n=1 Tax=Nocardiopsis aegyptia TaxID=220378 RepID=A0A7Z0EJX9_9ACTN|nr:hypothetical protein [Nocardiopsis aegyptia]NYJ33470.1 hypothetical protein [Nocardiopsis aegyptia]
MDTATNTPPRAPATRVRTAGLSCLVGAAVGVAGGLVTAFLPSSVPPEAYAYPYTPAGFVAAQLSFALNHVLLLVGIAGVAWSGAVGTHRYGRAGLWVAGAGMALLTVCELVGIAAVGEPLVSPLTGLLGAGYGFASVLIGAGLVAAGVAVLRTGRWSGWARPTVLVCGLAVFVIVLPGVFGPFVAGRLALTVWMLLFGALGAALMRDHDAGARRDAAGKARTV